MKQRVGFIGVGAIGRPMARNLAQKGFAVTVCDVDATRAEAVAAEIGGAVAAWPADLVSTCSVIVLMVPDAPEVEAVCFGERGIVAGGPRDLLVVNTTTMDPARSRAVAARGRASTPKSASTGPASGTRSRRASSRADASTICRRSSIA